MEGSGSLLAAQGALRNGIDPCFPDATTGLVPDGRVREPLTTFGDAQNELV